jgi:hypothetical protein
MVDLLYQYYDGHCLLSIAILNISEIGSISITGCKEEMDSTQLGHLELVQQWAVRHSKKCNWLQSFPPFYTWWKN